MVTDACLRLSASRSFKTGLKGPLLRVNKPNREHPTMTSFLVCHKEVNRFSPSRNPAEEAPLAGLKEEARLLPRPWITRTKPSRLGLAKGGGVVRRGCPQTRF